MLLFLLLVNLEPLKYLKTPFVRQWVVYGLPSLCPYGGLTCATLMFFTDRSISFLVSSHLWNICDSLLLEYASLPLEATQMEISSFECTPTFQLHPHWLSSPSPNAHVLPHGFPVASPVSISWNDQETSFLIYDGFSSLNTRSGLCAALPMAVISLFPCLSPARQQSMPNECSFCTSSE